MSTTRLLMLGLIRWLEPVHGYQVRQELLSWNVEDWANIAPGSIYHSLRKMTEEGLLEEAGTERVAGKPARTSYRTTRIGREEFYRLLRRYWWELRPAHDPFLAAMSFLPALSRREAVLALRNRAAVLRGQLDQSRAEQQTFDADGKPPHVGWLMELSDARAAAEITWCERMVGRIEAGEGTHEDDPGGDLAATMAAWRRSFGD